MFLIYGIQQFSEIVFRVCDEKMCKVVGKKGCTDELFMWKYLTLLDTAEHFGACLSPFNVFILKSTSVWQVCQSQLFFFFRALQYSIYILLKSKADVCLSNVLKYKENIVHTWLCFSCFISDACLWWSPITAGLKVNCFKRLCQKTGNVYDSVTLCCSCSHHQPANERVSACSERKDLIQEDPDTCSLLVNNTLCY